MCKYEWESQRYTMGRFKEFSIEETSESLTRVFKTKDQLPIKIKEYLVNQGYYFRSEGLTLKEERGITTDNLFFIGHTKYYSSQLIDTIQSEESDKRMIIKTDANYSFFEMPLNSFVDEEYWIILELLFSISLILSASEGIKSWPPYSLRQR